MPYLRLLPRFAARFSLLMWLVGAGGLLAGHPARAQVPLAGQPHFEWQNPLPTGFILNDLHAFSAHSAIVVGDGGAALRTADGGQTWQVLTTGTLNRILKVSFGDSLHGWLMYDTPETSPTQYLSGKGEVRHTADGGRTWALQNLGDPNATLRMKSLQAISATEAFVSYEYRTCNPRFPCGGLMQQALRHTTNGGQTWTQVTNSYPQVHDPNLEFTSPTTAYLTGGNIQWVGKSIDGGATWRRITPDTTGAVVFDQLSFVTPQHGWVTARVPFFATGQEPNLYRTRDGGQTWTPLHVFVFPPHTVISIVNVAFADTLRGVVVYYSGGQQQRAISTADGGQTWSVSAPFPSHYGTVRLAPDGSGWASGCKALSFDNYGNAAVGRTLDFGATWTTPCTSIESRPLLREPQFFGATRGWIIPTGDTALLTTTRRGAPWRRVPFTGGGVNWQNQGGVTVGDFVDADTGYVYLPEYTPLGVLNALILKTTDGGQSWTRQVLPLTNPLIFNVDLRFATSRRGALVGSDGLILVTQDGGQSWQQPPSPTTKSLRLLTWIDSLQALAIGDSLTVVRTSDGGQSWQAAPRFQQLYANEYLTFARFSTPLRGYLGAGALVETQDGGQTWTNVGTLLQPVNSNLASCAFLTSRRGLAFGSEAWGRTTDGGRTWQRIADLGASASFATLGTAVDDYNAWAVGQGGRILHYSEKFIQTDTSATQRTAFCTGDTFPVAFDTTGAFAAGDSVRVELSNRMGRFRPHQTTLIGRGVIAGRSVMATLPAGLAAGTHYRLRVIRADSSVLGGDNERDLTIYPRPAAVAVAPLDSARLCAGDSVQLSAPAGYGQYQWSSGDTTRTVWVQTDTTLTVQVAAGGGCFGPASRPVTVRVTPRPVAPTLVPTGSGPVLLTAAPALPGATYAWTGPGGAVVAGATGPTLLLTAAAQNGAYSVTVTARGCASPPSPAVNVLITGLEADADAAELTLSPNPAGTRVQVRSRAGLRTVTVRDLTGREVARVAGAGAEAVTVPVGALPAGLYLVHVTLADGRTGHRRLLIEH